MPMISMSSVIRDLSGIGTQKSSKLFLDEFVVAHDARVPFVLSNCQFAML